jgi:3-oxoacyl-[acyl-carrier protein] reductase
MFSLTGMTALVTGATGGIGQGVAAALHQQGATVILSGSRVEVLKEVQQSLGERTHIAPCNLADREAVQGFIAKVETEIAPLDILVCNAGVTRDGLSMRMKDEDFEYVLNLNLTTSFILNRLAIVSMMKRRFGRIINMASVVAINGNPGQANYAASKAGMIGFTKSMASEVASRGITMNCIAPGFIATPMTAALNDTQKERVMQAIPMGRMGEPVDIATATAFLASREAGYITGQTLHINGGMLMV